VHPALHLKLTHRTLEPLQAVGTEAAAFLDPVLSAFVADRIAWGSNLPAAEQSLPDLVILAQDVLAELSEYRTSRRSSPAPHGGCTPG
jgi:hypothetical protein